jgi:hypothetical protein
MHNKYFDGLHTTGHNILSAVLTHLERTTSIHTASHVLFAGGSAGGIGTFQNADWFADRVSVRPLRVRVLPLRV